MFLVFHHQLFSTLINPELIKGVRLPVCPFHVQILPVNFVNPIQLVWGWNGGIYDPCAIGVKGDAGLMGLEIHGTERLAVLECSQGLFTPAANQFFRDFVGGRMTQLREA